MTVSNNFNSSLNTLLASFTHIAPDSIGHMVGQDPIESICIDTSNNRIGINTLDPSYSLHIIDGNNGSDYSGNLYVSEFTCISGNINKLNIGQLDVSSINIRNGDPTFNINKPMLHVSSIYFKDTISGPTLDISRLDISSIFFKDTISGPTLDVSSIININTISGINLLFDVSKIDISGTIDLSYVEFKPKFFIPDTSAGLEPNQLYYNETGDSGILMIKIR